MVQTPEQQSLASYFQSLPIQEKRKRLARLTDEEAIALQYDWDYWARPTQLPPINKLWYIWLILAGRGWGKTRTGAEYIRGIVEDGYKGRIHLIGPTSADVRDTMLQGESGLIEISPPWNRPRYIPSARKVIWPSGATALTFSAEQPDRLRGPQCGVLWADELGSWRNPETWDMAMFGLRKGNPKAVVTTTPKPTKLIRNLINTKGVVVTKGDSYENRDNLADLFFDSIISKYEGTRLGEQEIYAKILEDTPGALWKLDDIAEHRISYKDFQDVDLVRIAIGIDPAATATDSSNLTGIVAAGIDANGEGYVLADGSGIYTPEGWASAAVKMFAALKADRIVAETNQGGDMVRATLRAIHPNIPYMGVHAARGKRARAEPVSALYERGLIHHVGVFSALEDQLTTWDATDGSPSPDRLDALVWVLTWLMLYNQTKTATSRQG